MPRSMPALGRIQNDLFDVEADLCLSEKGPGGARLTVTDAQVDWIEGEIDRLNAELAPLRSFILPGGTPAAAYMHLARTICRRAERIMVELQRPAGRDGHRRFAEIRQPAVGFPVRRRPLRQRQGRARRALGAGPEPMTPRGSAWIGCAAAVIAAAPASAATPLDDLIKPELNSSACFTRVYDAAHLRAHPRQKTTSMTAWLKYESIGGGVSGIALAFSFAITAARRCCRAVLPGRLRVAKNGQPRHLGQHA